MIVWLVNNKDPDCNANYAYFISWQRWGNATVARTETHCRERIATFSKTSNSIVKGDQPFPYTLERVR